MLLSACSTVHGVRPLGKGAVAVDATVGGPIVELFGAPVPMPLTTLGATVGVSDKTNVHAAIHPTGIALFGLVGGDVGASTQILSNEGARPRIMGDLTVYGLGGDVAPDGAEGGFRLFTRPTATVAWDWGTNRRSTVYGALSAYVEPLQGPKAMGTVALGNVWALSPKVGVTTEVEWLAPYAPTGDLAPNYYVGQGAVALHLGLSVLAWRASP